MTGATLQAGLASFGLCRPLQGAAFSCPADPPSLPEHPLLHHRTGPGEGFYSVNPPTMSRIVAAHRAGLA